MPYVALRSHVVETRLEWHTQPIYLSNEHSVALQFWMIVQVGVFKCQGQDCLLWSRSLLPLQHAFVKSVGMSAVDIRYWIFVLVMAPCFCRRCNRSWLLWRKCRLHFSHWKGKKKKNGATLFIKYIKSEFKGCYDVIVRFCHFLISEVEYGDLHGRAFLLCGYAGGSSTSAGAGSVFHRSHTDMASHPCGLTHGHGDEQPEARERKEKESNRLESHRLMKATFIKCYLWMSETGFNFFFFDVLESETL